MYLEFLAKFVTQKFRIWETERPLKARLSTINCLTNLVVQFKNPVDHLKCNLKNRPFFIKYTQKHFQ